MIKVNIMKFWLTIFVALILMPLSAKAADISFTVLRGKAAENALHQCSRGTPAGISGFWNPSSEIIEKLENDLPNLSEMSASNSNRAHKFSQDPKAFLRQYVGVVIGGRHFIYVNASPSTKMTPKQRAMWTQNADMVCDGGPDFWGALYDPETGKFSELELNGVA